MPDWFRLAHESERPPLPLPKGLVFGANPGEYENVKDGSVLLWVPPGPFLMGSEGEDDRERPIHEVELSGYFIGKLDVTVKQFAEFVAATHHVTTAEHRGSARVITVGGEYEAPGANWRDPEGTGKRAEPDYPVTQVSWPDAQTYLEWAGLMLPTEAQWEKAACWDPREKKSRRFSWGDDIPGALSPKVGNVADQTFLRVHPKLNAIFENYDDGYEKTSPVGAFPAGASPYGALDMTGNVTQWCYDAYQERFYSTGPRKDPVCEEGTERTARGGNFNYGPRLCRARRRGVIPPDQIAENLGFRVALGPR